MNDTPAEIRLPRLWLEAEAAELLRRAPAQVKRLRLTGKLGYYRRRPVIISQEDLEIYVAGAKMRRVKARGESKGFEYISAGATPGPFALLRQAEAAVKFKRTLRQIKYLCLRGHVPYIPGRSALIDEADLSPYLESKRAAAAAKVPGTPEFAALQEQKDEERMRHRLRVIRVRRQVERDLAEREAKGIPWAPCFPKNRR
jgi:hypothetical protein